MEEKTMEGIVNENKKKMLLFQLQMEVMKPAMNMRRRSGFSEGFLTAEAGTTKVQEATHLNGSYTVCCFLAGYKLQMAGV